MTLRQQRAAFWLAGFVDGEGCIAFYPKFSSRAVIIANTDPGLIKTTAHCCDLLGITYVIKTRKSKSPKWKDQLTVEIRGRDNLRRFHERVPIQCKAKQVKLEAAVTSYTKRRFDEIPRPSDADLQKMYWDECMSQTEMRKLYKVGPSTVRRWLEPLGELRGKSEGQSIANQKRWAKQKARARAL